MTFVNNAVSGWALSINNVVFERVNKLLYLSPIRFPTAASRVPFDSIQVHSPVQSKGGQELGKMSPERVAPKTVYVSLNSSYY